MKINRQTKLDDEQKKQIFALWNNEYPERLAYQSIENLENYFNKLYNQTHYLLLNEQNEIDGWATTFIRENEKWFAIIVSEKLHGKGIGTQMLNKLKEDEAVLNGWVIDHDSDKKLNGNYYKSPIEFYQKNGFEIIAETRLELDIMSAVKIKWIKSNWFH